MGSSAPDSNVSVIIPNLNGEKMLPSCLNALKQSVSQDIEVILVDNGSDDGSIKIAKSIIPDINIVSLGENQGFAGAVQKGILESKGKYIAVLNNDAVPEAGWIEGMVRAMESDSNIGMVACRVLNQDGSLIDSLGLGAARNGMAVLIGHGKPLDWVIPYGEPFGPSGAAGVYRREMLDQIGGFPGRFFCYYEDLWVAWQGRIRGWKCVLADEAVVHHLGQGTPLTGWKNRQYWITLNKWRTIISCWPSSLIFRYSLVLLWWEILVKVGEIFSGRFIQALTSRVKAFWEWGYWRAVYRNASVEAKIPLKECHKWMIPSPKLADLIGRRMR